MAGVDAADVGAGTLRTINRILAVGCVLVWLWYFHTLVLIHS